MDLIPVLVPFAAAIAFPFATMALKRAMELNRDSWGTLFICNAAIALICLPLLLWDPGTLPAQGADPAAGTAAGSAPGSAADSIPGPALWQPLLSGLLFFLAQAAAFRSFATGELSVAIPAQGSKVLMVAGLTVAMLGQSVSPRLWSAAALTVAAMYFLRDPESGDGEKKRDRSTLVYALIAAACFAAFDVSIQKWSPAWGALRFAPWAFLAQAVLSLSLLPLAKKNGFQNRFHGRFRYSARAWAWLLWGSLGLGIITLALVAVIGAFGKATLVNILFNSRCVWSVVFIWCAGRWFGNREAKAGRHAMGRRLAGATMMMAAILLALA